MEIFGAGLGVSQRCDQQRQQQHSACFRVEVAMRLMMSMAHHDANLCMHGLGKGFHPILKKWIEVGYMQALTRRTLASSDMRGGQQWCLQTRDVTWLGNGIPFFHVRGSDRTVGAWVKVHGFMLRSQGCCRWACQKTFLSLPGASAVKAAELQVTQVPGIRRYFPWLLLLKTSKIFCMAA